MGQAVECLLCKYRALSSTKKKKKKEKKEREQEKRAETKSS
jgi:hypothetical protein